MRSLKLLLGVMLMTVTFALAGCSSPSTEPADDTAAPAETELESAEEAVTDEDMEETVEAVEEVEETEAEEVPAPEAE